MRIIERAIAVLVLGLVGTGLYPALGFEGSRVEPAVDCGPQTVKAGDPTKSMVALQYAAEQGNAVAQWKLGRMYATGEIRREGTALRPARLRIFQPDRQRPCR
jgi:hypothetical protein